MVFHIVLPFSHRLIFLFHFGCIFQLFLKKTHLLNQQFVSFFSERNVVKSPGYDQTAEKIEKPVQYDQPF